MRYQTLFSGVLCVASFVSAVVITVRMDLESILLPFLQCLLVVAALFFLALSMYFCSLNDPLNDLERGEMSTSLPTVLEQEHIIIVEIPRKITELEISKANLQEIEYEASEENMFTSCVICLGDFEEGKLCSVFPNCQHKAFHKDCLITWFNKGQLNCPVCRCNLLIEIPPEC
ncbi:hypothetical protein ACFE04_010517 [Oxalis oulophora]